VRNLSMIVVALIALACASPALAQQERTVTTWFSTTGSVGSGFTPGDPAIEVPLGATGSLYLWVRNEYQLISVAYDLALETPGILELTGVDIFNPDVIGDGLDIGDRWNLPVAAGTLSGDGQKLETFGAVNVTAFGLHPDTKILDELYDAGADAALLGRIDFRSIGLGSTELLLTKGNPRIVEEPPFQETYITGSATVTVVVPEPSCILLALLLAGGLASWRRLVGLPL
jgi:hypothetical protein